MITRLLTLHSSALLLWSASPAVISLGVSSTPSSFVPFKSWYRSGGAQLSPQIFLQSSRPPVCLLLPSSLLPLYFTSHSRVFEAVSYLCCFLYTKQVPAVLFIEEFC